MSNFDILHKVMMKVIFSSSLLKVELQFLLLYCYKKSLDFSHLKVEFRQTTLDHVQKLEFQITRISVWKNRN